MWVTKQEESDPLEVDSKDRAVITQSRTRRFIEVASNPPVAEGFFDPDFACTASPDAVRVYLGSSRLSTCVPSSITPISAPACRHTKIGVVQEPVGGNSGVIRLIGGNAPGHNICMNLRVCLRDFT